jgi:hypothetical protein
VTAWEASASTKIGLAGTLHKMVVPIAYLLPFQNKQSRATYFQLVKGTPH